MTKQQIQKMEDLADAWQNKGCVEGLALFENSRTRWAANDFKAGYQAAMSEFDEELEQLTICQKNEIELHEICVKQKVKLDAALDIINKMQAALNLANLKMGRHVAHPQSVWFEEHVLEPQRSTLAETSKLLEKLKGE